MIKYSHNVVVSQTLATFLLYVQICTNYKNTKTSSAFISKLSFSTFASLQKMQRIMNTLTPLNTTRTNVSVSTPIHTYMYTLYIYIYTCIYIYIYIYLNIYLYNIDKYLKSYLYHFLPLSVSM